MAIPVIAFFNNKGGVGKTSLVYHIAWMLSELGWNVLAADLDPQANLTGAFLDEDRLEELWQQGQQIPNTIYRMVQPLVKGVGDVSNTPRLEKIEQRLTLLAGDLALSGFEDQLSEVWPKCMDGDERSFRVISSLWRALQSAAEIVDASVILMDLGPNLGAINRSALIASDYIVVPLTPDLYSLQGLRNLGPTLRHWRNDWKERVPRNPAEDLLLPPGRMKTIGYIVMQHAVRLDRPVKAYMRWIAQIPGTYCKDVLDEEICDEREITQDPNCLALLKNYQSLMPMAQEAHKPMFHLKPADGALGAHGKAVTNAFNDFRKLTKKILEAAGIHSMALS
ncbi:ParA family protein [Gloeobacter morelensis]|uniref:AAA family ATPase n=1 Tax=Gloeobacter morelensis MG652769 TaxID=2781736 RepID=A0ABY3PT36_9CYAN|nr:AAA family ATPase [Gloeobacter morelensis]UFP96846.1 AAA family ATPase [Gloeobacter morelensis MG652769]